MAVDSSVLLDVLGADLRFGERSREALRAAYDRGALALLARDRGFYGGRFRVQIIDPSRA